MDSNHGQRMCAGRRSLSSSFQPGCRQRHPAPGGICGLLQVKSLWALWFVDDGILCFRNMQQLQRLFPRLQQSLAHLGLQINMSKSKLLGWSLPAMLPTCVDGIQVVQQTVSRSASPTMILVLFKTCCEDRSRLSSATAGSWLNPPSQSLSVCGCLTPLWHLPYGGLLARCCLLFQLWTHYGFSALPC